MVIDVEPVAAMFDGVLALNALLSVENTWVILAVRSPTVKTIPTVPPDHRLAKQLNAESETQVVFSHPVRAKRARIVCK
jgi:hypothetical protein